MSLIHKRSFLGAFLFVPILASAADSIEALGFRWMVPLQSEWKVEKVDGIETLSLLVPKPSTQPRRPTQFALAETPDYLTATVEAEVKKEPKALRNRKNSLIIVYAYRDADHFNYVHMSDDVGTASPQHNGIFHVYGGDRVRISPTEGEATLTEEKWYKVKLVYDGRSGMVELFVDGKTSRSFRACDMSLGAGRFGIGSFFDTGQFRNVKITGVTSKTR
jgi:hypothetical protein